MTKDYQTATFAAGCFWGVEARFRDLTGVFDAAVGYTGGHKTDPTYREVCTDTTGHAEAVEVIFDPERISFDDLVEAFYDMHDPTTLNRQGPDVGSQYRSAIYYHNDEQKQAAQRITDQLNQSTRYQGQIVTEITESAPFYRAEEYHQRYFDKMGRRGGCHSI